MSKQGSLLVVAGSGRSGTSLFTGLVSKLGLHIPQPEFEADETNPRGFGEPQWAIDFHRELLRSVDVKHDDARPRAWELTARVASRKRAQSRLRSWLEDQYELSDHVVVKDPRLAPFLDLYRHVASDLSVELSVVTMLRHPAETVRSKEIAYGDYLGSTTRMAGWLNMMLCCEHATRDLPRAIITYDDLLAQWQPTLRMTEEVLPLALTSGASPEQMAAADELVDPSLRKSPPDWAELRLPPALQDLAERAYHELCALAVSPAGGSRPTPTVDGIDDVRTAYAGYYREAEAVARSSIQAARAAERRRMSRERQTGQQETVDPATAVDGRTLAGWRRRASHLLKGARS